jgi:hypothetical protein
MASLVWLGGIAQPAPHLSSPRFARDDKSRQQKVVSTLVPSGNCRWVGVRAIS